MDTQDYSPNIRICSRCHCEFPETAEYFYRDTRGKHGLSYTCKSCRKLQSKTWYDCNKERARARAKQYYLEHAESEKARVRQWALDNPERALERSLRYRQSHAPESRKRAREWAKSNPEKYAANSRLYTRRRRARKLSVPGEHTKADEIAQVERQRGKCYYCGCKLTTHPRQPNSMTVDHVIPLTRQGATDSPDNIVIACMTCNARKNNRLPHEWNEGGRLL